MTKKEAIELLVKEGWTKADAKRALSSIDFTTQPDELYIRRVASNFAGQELYKRQRLQAAQKAMVTKRTKEVTSSAAINKELQRNNQQLSNKNEKLQEVNSELQQDNKALQTKIKQIQLRLAMDVRGLLEFENSELRRELIKWYRRTQG